MSALLSLFDFASSPRFQRYVSKRAKKQVTEDPDPFSTHQVMTNAPLYNEQGRSKTLTAV